jgi:hypothetical protein
MRPSKAEKFGKGVAMAMTMIQQPRFPEGFFTAMNRGAHLCPPHGICEAFAYMPARAAANRIPAPSCSAVKEIKMWDSRGFLRLL